MALNPDNQLIFIAPSNPFVEMSPMLWNGSCPPKYTPGMFDVHVGQPVYGKVGTYNVSGTGRLGTTTIMNHGFALRTPFGTQILPPVVSQQSSLDLDCYGNITRTTTKTYSPYASSSCSGSSYPSSSSYQSSSNAQSITPIGVSTVVGATGKVMKAHDGSELRPQTDGTYMLYRCYNGRLGAGMPCREIPSWFIPR